MIAVGIDVSKFKSTVAILNGDGNIRAKPFDVHHVADELQALVDLSKSHLPPPISRAKASRKANTRNHLPLITPPPDFPLLGLLD